MRMEQAVECTHCGVVMTSWSAPASPIRYFQCPFCQRTLSSNYGEVFRSRAGARVVTSSAKSAPPSAIPTARPEDVRWATIRSAANRWYARLEADERRNADLARQTVRPPRPIPLVVTVEQSRRADPVPGLQVDVEHEATAQPASAVAAVGAAKRR
jgi:ribosomal protein L24E